MPVYVARDWSTTDSRLHRFWGHLIWAPKFNKGIKRKTNVLHENKKQPSVTVFSKLNIESEHINAANGTKIIIVL